MKTDVFYDKKKKEKLFWLRRLKEEIFYSSFMNFIFCYTRRARFISLSIPTLFIYSL